MEESKRGKKTGTGPLFEVFEPDAVLAAFEKAKWSVDEAVEILVSIARDPAVANRDRLIALRLLLPEKPRGSTPTRKEPVSRASDHDRIRTQAAHTEEMLSQSLRQNLMESPGLTRSTPRTTDTEDLDDVARTDSDGRSRLDPSDRGGPNPDPSPLNPDAAEPSGRAGPHESPSGVAGPQEVRAQAPANFARGAPSLPEGHPLARPIDPRTGLRATPCQDGGPRKTTPGFARFTRAPEARTRLDNGGSVEAVVRDTQPPQASGPSSGNGQTPDSGPPSTGSPRSLRSEPPSDGSHDAEIRKASNEFGFRAPIDPARRRLNRGAGHRPLSERPAGDPGEVREGCPQPDPLEG